jgi:hypothetical protein
VAVLLPAAPPRETPGELLLCGHHYRLFSQLLLSTGAIPMGLSASVVGEHPVDIVRVPVQRDGS